MTPSGTVRDVVSIGFGPSGLALAVALEEQGMLDSALFLERESEFSWHKGMLLDDARIQVSCLKDLATLRDPRSRFTFLNYLKSVGRLDEFVNMQTLRPTRVEFNDYLRWAADKFRSSVEYGMEVSSVEPVTARGGTEVVALRIAARDLREGLECAHLARNVVLGAGAEPRVPVGVDLSRSERMFHSRDFLARMAEHVAQNEKGRRFLVVGDGQSAAEIFDLLASRYPDAHVTATTRGIGYRPMDETPFVNEIFFPRTVDLFYGLPERKRRAVLASLRNANYGVADRELIQRIYRRLYDARVAGARTLEIRPFLTLTSAAETGGHVTMEFEDWVGDRIVRLEADTLVMATGYEIRNPHPLLEGLADHLETDRSGRYRVERDYRVATKDGFEPGVFLQGYAEDTHGIGDTLLSLASIRAWEIGKSIGVSGRSARPRRRRFRDRAIAGRPK